MKKPSFKVWFADFFPRCANFFKEVLSEHFDLSFDSSSPDYLFFSDFGDENERYTKAVRIYYTGENRRPNFSKADFALTFDYLDQPNHYRLPLYVIENYSRWKEYACIDSFDSLVRSKPSAESLLRSKTKFCNFVVSNPHCEIRNKFFELLNQYKRVDSAGSHLNNMGFTLPKEEHLFFKAKLEFQRAYKFSIAFENSAYPGYLTEKILDPMLAYSLPIYWGDPLVHQDFNPKSFINAAAFRTLEDLVAWVVKVDQVDELYFKYAEQPYFYDSKLNAAMDLNRLIQFFKEKVFRLPAA
jgi:hypothetical protein